MSTEMRLDEVERRLEQMGTRMRNLEREVGVETYDRQLSPRRVTPPRQPVSTPPPGYTPAPAASEPARPLRSDSAGFEELFGGRVLAWIGGLAILLGIVLFMGMAIERGWLGETARTVIAMLGSTALLFAGVWLQERRGQAEAARAAVAAALSGLYATLCVATQTYDLIPAGSGLIFAALVAGVGWAIAVRWSSPVVAAIGSLGALAAPLLVDAGTSGVSIAFVALALAATVGIQVWQRWDWLALGAFVISVPQLVAWMIEEHYHYLELAQGDHIALVLTVLVGFWALYVIAALGFELRSEDEPMLPFASALLLVGSCALVIIGGTSVFDAAGMESAEAIWVFGFSAVYLLLGSIALHAGVHREIGALLIGTGIALSGLGFAEVLDGPGLVLAWAAESAALAFLAARFDVSVAADRSSAERLLLAAGAFLLLAAGHVLLFEAQPAAMIDGVDDLGTAVAALAACAAAALACHRLGRQVDDVGAMAAAALGAAFLVYLGSVAIVDTIGVGAYGETREAGQVWLSAFWATTGLGAVVWGLMRRSAEVRLGGLALLGLAIAKVWTYDLSELDEIARVLSFVGLGLLLLVGAYAYQRIKPVEEADQREPRASL